MYTEQTCEACGGLSWVISVRDNGHLAIQRCDDCAGQFMFDVDAAEIAQYYSINCEQTYPCFVNEEG